MNRDRPRFETVMVEGFGVVLDHDAVCPKCGSTPSQVLGGGFERGPDRRERWIRYRCRTPECEHEFRLEDVNAVEKDRGPRCLAMEALSAANGLASTADSGGRW